MSEPLQMTPLLESTLVFAARYTHHRNTGGALHVVRTLEALWDKLSERVRQQILEEAKEATTNLWEWSRLQRFAELRQQGSQVCVVCSKEIPQAAVIYWRPPATGKSTDLFPRGGPFCSRRCLELEHPESRPMNLRKVSD